MLCPIHTVKEKMRASAMILPKLPKQKNCLSISSLAPIYREPAAMAISRLMP